MVLYVLKTWSANKSDIYMQRSEFSILSYDKFSFLQYHSQGLSALTTSFFFNRMAGILWVQPCDTSPNTFIHFERAWVPEMQSLLYTKICMTMSILLDCLTLHTILGMITHHVSVVCWRLWTVLTEVSDLKPYDLYMSALRWILFYKSSHRSVSPIH